jgi:hypothetical protein
MVDSHSISFHSAEHKLLAYPQRSNLLSWSILSLRVISRTEVQTGAHGLM